MNEVLFDAILSMDAYNRGYNQGISSLPDVPGKTTLGNALIIQESDIDPTSTDYTNGFYALAYLESNGDVVISYRGTDETITPGAKDVLFG